MSASLFLQFVESVLHLCLSCLSSEEFLHYNFCLFSSGGKALPAPSMLYGKVEMCDLVFGDSVSPSLLLFLSDSCQEKVFGSLEGERSHADLSLRE